MNDNPQTVTIHKARKEDAEAIAQLAADLAAHEADETLCTEDSIKRLLKRKGEPKCHCIVAKLEERIVGFALYYAGYDLSSDSYGFHLADICVREVFRKQGIGKMMLGHIAKQAEDEKREWISLTTLTNNKEAQGFYMSLGFTLVEVNFNAAGSSTLERLKEALVPRKKTMEP